MSQPSSAPWDAGRFVRTLMFFESLPFLGSFSWLREALETILPLSQTTSPAMSNSSSGLILVAGATGGVGKRVVQRLRSQGYRVRAIVRDPERGKQVFGDDATPAPEASLELMAADITRPETLTPALMQEVEAVISCIGTRVQPVEGDTPNRDKYYQGIKFYQPEVVGDTPEAVEYQGIQNLLSLAKTHFATSPPPGELSIFDFRHPTEDMKQLWGALDDVVMGGVSESNLQLRQGAALFNGSVSTANSGGFASVRTKNLNPPLDLRGYEGIQLRLRGDGKRYKIFLRSDDRWDGVGYAHSFDTVANNWITLSIPFASFVPVLRARIARDAPPLDLSQIYSLQLMLSKFEYDGALNPHFSPGAFALEVELIAAYGGLRLPRWIMVSSAGVTRPGRPDLDLEQEPPAVRMNEQLGGILTWKLRGEEVVRSSGLPYTIIRPCALTEEPGNQPLQFSQGDTLKGKVSRDAIAELCVECLKLPQASDRTFEVAAGEVAAGDSDCQPGDWDCLFAPLQPD